MVGAGNETLRKDLADVGLSVCPSPVHADQDPGPEPGRVLADGLDVGYFDRRWTPNEKPAV